MNDQPYDLSVPTGQDVIVQRTWSSTPNEDGRYTWRVVLVTGGSYTVFRQGTATTAELAEWFSEGYALMAHDWYGGTIDE